VNTYHGSIITISIVQSNAIEKVLSKRMKLQRPPLKLLFPLLAISLFAVVSYAVSVTVTTTTYASDNGVYFNVTGGFTATSNGFNVVQAAGTATTLPATWANGGTVQNTLVAGDWEYSVTLTLNAAATVSHTYTFTVQWNTGSGYTTLGIPLTVTTLATITAGQTMTFLLDTGSTSITAPAGVTITVA
jgi:hypothetical protein